MKSGNRGWDVRWDRVRKRVGWKVVKSETGGGIEGGIECEIEGGIGEERREIFTIIK